MSRFGADLLQRALQAVGAAGAPGPAAPAAGPAPAPVPRPAPPVAGAASADAVAIAAALCRRFEGLHLQPYLCPAGVPTIGYGATHYLDGRPVTLRDPAITRQQAEELLVGMIQRTYLPAVRRLCPGVSDHQRLAALIDFTFNLGAGALSASTLRRRVNAGEWDAVPPELRRWVRGGGRVLRGLVLRREAEVALI